MISGRNEEEIVMLWKRRINVDDVTEDEQLKSLKNMRSRKEIYLVRGDYC